MSDKTIPDEYRVDVGRADRGRTFVRVVHLPTGKDRSLIGIGKAEVDDVAFKLAEELAEEIGAKNLGSSASREVRKKKIVG
jgi:hypothetical protein